MNRYAIRFAKRWYESTLNNFLEDYNYYQNDLLGHLDDLARATERQLKLTKTGNYDLSRDLVRTWEQTQYAFEHPPKTPRPSYETILRGTIQATEHPKVTIDPEEWRLLWVTDPITLTDDDDTDHFIGPIRIVLQNGYYLRVYPINDTDQDDWHPHVSGTRPCLGAYGTSINALLDAGYFVEALMQIEAILKNYSSSDAYWKYERNLVHCSWCGEEIDSIDAYHCQVCDTALCVHCYCHCKICDDIYCEDHIYRCEECNRYVCFDHMYECSGGTYCIECTGLCDKCNSQHLISELECCEKCNRKLCPDCHDHCTDCEITLCSECASTCENCGDVYCTDCLDEDQLCKECQDEDQLCTECQDANTTENTPTNQLETP